MPIAWDDEPPPLAQLHADVLRTERNAAVAEAKLWLRRVGEMQRERDQARAHLHAADKCLGEWQQAYDDLLREFRRLEVKRDAIEWELDSANFLLRHLDPFLPLFLQDQQRRIAEADLYANVAKGIANREFEAPIEA